MTRPAPILVVGATGTVGAALVAALRGQGTAVRALVRDPGKLADGALPGVDVARGDLRDAATLADALAGARAAFLLTKPHPDQAALEQGFVAAARAAGCAHVVRLSVLAADPAAASPVRRWHGAADAALRASGLAATILRPNFFMQNMLMFARAIAGRGSFSLPAAAAAVSLIDVRDIAEVAAALLTGRHPAGGVHALTGPQALDFAAVARAIGDAAGRPVAYVPGDPAAFRDRLTAAGQPAWYAEAMAALYDDFRAGLNAPVSPAVDAILGRPPREFAAFARDHAARWRG
jgi:uncharacterized protein YbjT (DUF2867 family)